MNIVRNVLDESACGTTQAAKMLQVSVGTIHHMVERGELDAWTTGGGHRRVTLESIRNCQLRRRIRASSCQAGTTGVSVVVLGNDEVFLKKLKWVFQANDSEHKKTVTYFSHHMQMMLDLESLAPQLIVLDKESLNQLGGPDWFSQLRKKDRYRQTQLLLVGHVFSPEEMAGAMISKVDVMVEPVDPTWLAGYLHAVASLWELSWHL